MNEIKVRAGYGVNGNDGTLSPNQYESLMATGYNYYFGGAPSVSLGSAPATLSNPDLHWEETTQKSIGVDFKLFNNPNLGTVIVMANSMILFGITGGLSSVIVGQFV